MLLLSIKETYLLNSCNDIWETKCGSRQPGDTMHHYYKAGTLNPSRSCCSWITEVILRVYWKYEVPFSGKHWVLLILLFRNCETGNVITSLVWSHRALALLWLLSFPQRQSWQILMKPVQTKQSSASHRNVTLSSINSLTRSWTVRNLMISQLDSVNTTSADD